MKKSTRHSKITGDFAEAFVLCHLSKAGYECAVVDHTGIDIIACSRDGLKRNGISVKARSRYDGTEASSINLGTDDFAKARDACKSFGCRPYYAILVDARTSIRCFLLPLDEVEALVTGGGATRHWQMSDQFLDRYFANSGIEYLEYSLTRSSWMDVAGNSEDA
jgi:hypothetical protein